MRKNSRRGSVTAVLLGWRTDVTPSFRLTGTLTTNRPKSPWASRRFAMREARPFGTYRSGFDHCARAIRIPPPAYPCPGLRPPRRQAAEQDRGREHNERPPMFHGYGKCQVGKRSATIVSSVGCVQFRGAAERELTDRA